MQAPEPALTLPLVVLCMQLTKVMDTLAGKGTGSLTLGGQKYMVIGTDAGDVGASVRGKKGGGPMHTSANSQECTAGAAQLLRRSNVLVASPAAVSIRQVLLLRQTSGRHQHKLCRRDQHSLGCNDGAWLGAGQGGLTVKKTNSALVVGIYGEGCQPADCNITVERLGDYLIDQGI